MRSEDLFADLFGVAVLGCCPCGNHPFLPRLGNGAGTDVVSYAHLGRFAAEYRELFGEPPSIILAER